MFTAPGRLIGFKLSEAFAFVSEYYVDDAQNTVYYVDDSQTTYLQYED